MPAPFLTVPIEHGISLNDRTSVSPDQDGGCDWIKVLKIDPDPCASNGDSARPWMENPSQRDDQVARSSGPPTFSKKCCSGRRCRFLRC